MHALRRLSAVGALVLLATTGASCIGRGPAPRPGEVRVVDLAGDVTARFPGRERDVRLSKGQRIPNGAEITTGREALLRLAIGQSRGVELAANTQATLVSAGRMTLDTGRLLSESAVTASAGSLLLDARGVSIRGGATMRVERLVGALRVGVYSGSASISSLGRDMDVPALREVLIAGGVPLERAPRPISLSADDRWDRRLLGDVLDFDRDLGQFGRGFDQEFAGQAGSPAFFAPFVPLGNPGFLTGVLNQNDPSDVLVGLVFALTLSGRDGTPLADHFAGLLAERALGATWGLIAKEHGLQLRDLFGAVLEAIKRGTTPPAQSSSSSSNSVSSRPRPGPSGSPQPTPQPTPTGTPTTPPTPPTCSTINQLLGRCQGSRNNATSTQAPASTECTVLESLLEDRC